MEETVSAAEANREFSRLLRGVREGNSYIVTSHGRAVARIVPAGDASKDMQAREDAYQKLLARLRRQPVLNLDRMTRDEMNERDR